MSASVVAKCLGCERLFCTGQPEVPTITRCPDGCRTVVHPDRVGQLVDFLPQPSVIAYVPAKLTGELLERFQKQWYAMWCLCAVREIPDG